MFEDFIFLDTTGDGLDDSLLFFQDDGSQVIYSDYNYDGYYEQMAVQSGFDAMGNPSELAILLDTDNNGVFDYGFTEFYDNFGHPVVHAEMTDYDQDGQPDYIKVFEDTTGDGKYDTKTEIHADNSDSPVVQKMDVFVDQTGDQTPDIHVHSDFIDLTGNGQPDQANVVISDNDGNEFKYEIPYNEYEQFGGGFGYTTMGVQSNMALGAQFDPSQADPSLVSGDPVSDMELWEYQGPTSRCAIYAQKFAIEEALGREIPIDELVSVAEENGWFDDASGSGTVTLNMDKLLTYYGVEHEVSFDNDIDSLEQALKDGKNVIVGVDSSQIWYGKDNNIFSPTTSADHALQIIGIDRTDSQHPMAILNDSGSPDGRGELVPLDIFENAWSAGDRQMIVCEARA